MKIVGQSVTAPKMTYLHLAYMAAKTLTPNPKTLGIGGIALMSGILMILIVKMFRIR